MCGLRCSFNTYMISRLFGRPPTKLVVLHNCARKRVLFLCATMNQGKLNTPTDILQLGWIYL